MNNHEITWYMQELGMHGFGASREFQALETAIADPDTVQSRVVWFHLTSFLAHAAMISKYLSPINPRGIKQTRMQVLRDKLNINDASAILSRDARDNVEHFDERVDNWIGSGDGAILEVVIPNRRGYDFLRAHEKRIKRLLLAEEMIFISERRDGSQLELLLEPLVIEAKRIGDEANRWIGEESPYHFIYPQQVR